MREGLHKLKEVEVGREEEVEIYPQREEQKTGETFKEAIIT